MNTSNISAEAKAYFGEGVRLSQHPSTVDQSAAAFEEAIRLHPEYAEAYFELGTMYYRWSHFHKAIEPLKKAIELEPHQPAAYGNLGMNYNLAGMYPDAEEILRKLIEIVPDHASGHYELGFALLQQGRPEEAVEHFRKTVKLHPQHAMAYYFLSLALVCYVRDFSGAKQLLRELQELHPAEAKHLALLISLNDPSQR